MKRELIITEEPGSGEPPSNSPVGERPNADEESQ